MNFTFTWILDKFGFQAKPAFDFPVKPEVKKAVAKKVAKKTVKIAKATTRTSKTKK
jgi:hypothetical protein